MAQVKDVTGYVIRNTIGPGEHVKRVQNARPAFSLTPSLTAFLEKLRAPSDKTVGYVSNALAYARTITGSTKTYHSNMARLIKGGHIQVCEVPRASTAGKQCASRHAVQQSVLLLEGGPQLSDGDRARRGDVPRCTS